MHCLELCIDATVCHCICDFVKQQFAICVPASRAGTFRHACGTNTIQVQQQWRQLGSRTATWRTSRGRHRQKHTARRCRQQNRAEQSRADGLQSSMCLMMKLKTRPGHRARSRSWLTTRKLTTTGALNAFSAIAHSLHLNVLSLWCPSPVQRPGTAHAF